MSAISKQDAGSAGLVMAAGSLRAAMEEMLAEYRAETGNSFDTLYGPSGKLRQEIERGARPASFASASIDHLEALAAQHLLLPPAVFACNALCVVLRAGLHIDEAQLVKSLCDPSLRVATSTPGSDPMGDYTWQLFGKMDLLHPGASRLLQDKALKLSGAHIPAVDERSPYLAAFEDGTADAYIMYRTNALLVKRSLPQLRIVSIPDVYNVRCEYGISAAPDADAGRRFVDWVLSAAGQEILKRQGFDTL
jgi:molybdenum ABC transporter molybdate-binding protein